MKRPVHLLLLVLLSIASCNNKQESTNSDNLPYQETWESVSNYPKAPDFFLDAKFGIYTHWGPVTVGTDHPDAVGRVQWYGKFMYDINSPTFTYHKERFGDQYKFGYKDVTKLFKGENFDAKEWADLFAKSGAKFAGPVAIHHDNYAMWDSEINPWNSMDQMPKRDFTGELAKEIKANGMLFFASFHHSFAWDYFLESYQYDAADPTLKALYCEPHTEHDPPSREFLENWADMINEVVVKYEPDMIWFDFGLGKLIPDEYQIKMFSGYYNWASAKNKEVAVFHKHEKIQRYTGILDFERGRADQLTKLPWLTDTSVGPWFHQPSHKYKTTNQLIDVFVDIVSKNGCLLLNVGPKVDGTIPEEAVKILTEMGEWLAMNGEAIYETRPWIKYGEGPAKMKGGGGFSEHKAPVNYSAKDIRFTRSKNEKTVYAIVLGWPENNEVNISSFTAEGGLNSETISKVSLLGSDARIEMSKTTEGVKIGLPEKKHCEHAFALKFELH